MYTTTQGCMVVYITAQYRHVVVYWSGKGEGGRTRSHALSIT